MKAMLARVHSRLTFANVMSLTALFFALGGGAYAMTIPKNSVGALQLKSSAVSGPKIKKDAVTSAKVLDGSLLAQDFKTGQLPAGPPGPQGPKGDPGGGGGPPSGPAGGGLRGVYPNPTLAPGSVGTDQIVGGAVDAAKVRDGSLTGADIDESSLDQVPFALLGGYGRQSPKKNCAPNATTQIYVTCTSVTVTLPAVARALVIGRITAYHPGAGSGNAAGNCVLVTVPGGAIANSAIRPSVSPNALESVPLVGVTGLLPPGPTLFALDCNQDLGPAGLSFLEATLSVVVLSPS